MLSSRRHLTLLAADCFCFWLLRLLRLLLLVVDRAPRKRHRGQTLFRLRAAAAARFAPTPKAAVRCCRCRCCRSEETAEEAHTHTKRRPPLVRCCSLGPNFRFVWRRCCRRRRRRGCSRSQRCYGRVANADADTAAAVAVAAVVVAAASARRTTSASTDGAQSTAACV